MSGFTLLPVVLAMSLIASIAFMLNRTNALTANMVESRADFERARYAAEAGLQAVNYMVQQAGCAGTYPTSAAPLVDAAFAGSAYSAYASAASGSPLTLTSTGTHNGASVTLTRSNAYVYQSGVRTYVRQPNASGIDTRVHVGKAKENFGDSDELKIKADDWESLLKFDLAFLPAGSRVIPWFDSFTGSLQPGALLQIYKKHDSGTPSRPEYIDALVINQGGWLEGNGVDWSGATWTTYDGVRTWAQPGVGYDVRPVSTNLARNTEGWQSIVLTDAVRAWMGTVYPNNGVWLRSSPSGDPVGDYKYHSSDYTSQWWLRPRLTLSYLLPCGASAPP
jgi:hypothetical protein